jgi:hypothetical protein
MVKRVQLFKVGDLVEFIYGRLGASVNKYGIVVERMSGMTRDDMYKIRAGAKDYWIPRTRIELLSKAIKAGPK